MSAHHLTLVCAARPLQPTFPDRDEVDEAALARIAAALPAASVTTDRVWTGPDAMTRRTAELVLPGASMEAALAEIDFGAWRGRRLDEVAAAEADGFGLWLAGEAPHGGESVADLIARVGLWLSGVAGLSGGSIAVAPGSVVKAAALAALEAPASSFARLDVTPLCACQLSSDGRRWTLRTFGARWEGAPLSSPLRGGVGGGGGAG